MQSANTGSSTGVCAGSPTCPPTRRSLSLAEKVGPWEEQGLTAHPILAAALQIHFLANLILHTKRKFHLQRDQGSAEKARGQEDVLFASNGNRASGTHGHSAKRTWRITHPPPLERASVQGPELDTSQTPSPHSQLLRRSGAVSIFQTRRGRLKV